MIALRIISEIQELEILNEVINSQNYQAHRLDLTGVSKKALNMYMVGKVIWNKMQLRFI